jgi:hypothetical protein
MKQRKKPVTRNARRREDDGLTDAEVQTAERLGRQHRALVLAGALAVRMGTDDQPLANILVPFIMMAYAESGGAVRNEKHDHPLLEAAAAMLDAANRFAAIVAGLVPAEAGEAGSEGGTLH